MGKREKLIKASELEKVNCKENFHVLNINSNTRFVGIVGSKNGGITNCTEMFISKLVSGYDVDSYTLSVVDCGEELADDCEINRIRSMEHVIKNCSCGDLAKFMNSVRAGLKDNTGKKRIIVIHDLSILIGKCSQGQESNLMGVLTDFIGEIKGHPNTLIVLATNDFFTRNIKGLMDEIIVFKSAISLSNRYLGSTKASSVKAGVYHRVINNKPLEEKEKIPLIEKAVFQANLATVRKYI